VLLRSSFQTRRVIRTLQNQSQNHSIRCYLKLTPSCTRQRRLAMVPPFQKKKKSAPTNFLGRRRPREWGYSAVRNARAVKLTARLRRSTLASLTVSAPPIMTHMEQESNLANVQSPMPAQPPPMLERAQQRCARQSPCPRSSTLALLSTFGTMPCRRR